MKKMTEKVTSSLPAEAGVTKEPLEIDPKFSKQLATVLPSYLKIKDALVASDKQAASSGSKNFSSYLEKVDMTLLKDHAHTKWMNNLTAMQQSVKAIQASDDIEKQRASFSDLTDALYSSFKTFSVSGLKAYYQFCPMAFDRKGAYWISRDEQISNPYFGDQMLRCAETKEIIK